MKTILLGVIAAATLMLSAPMEADARPRGYWGPRTYYRSYYRRPYRVNPYLYEAYPYRTYYRPNYRAYPYRGGYYGGFYGPSYYYRGPGVSVGIY